MRYFKYSKERWIGVFKYYAMVSITENNLGLELRVFGFLTYHLYQIFFLIGLFLIFKNVSVSFMKKLLCFRIHTLAQWFSIWAAH